MRKRMLTIALFSLLPLALSAKEGKVYRWIDVDGQVHYGDSVPVEYSDLPKEVLNDHGVTVDNVQGKKTDEEREFYLLITKKERYSKRELERQIESGLYDRTMLAENKLSTIFVFIKSC